MPTQEKAPSLWMQTKGFGGVSTNGFTESYSTISKALEYISPDTDRLSWVRILTAVKSEFGEAGEDLARDWSAQSDKYHARDFKSTWKSIDAFCGVTLGTLIYEAQRNGWTQETPFKPFLVESKPPEQAKTFNYAKELFAKSSECDEHVAAHQYARRKGVCWAAGARRGFATGRLIGQHADCIVVPMRDLKGNFKGVECINPEGKKQTFGNKGVLILGNDLDASLLQLIVEGWATGAQLMQYYRGNVAIYICFGKGKVESFANELDATNPMLNITICEELDD